MSLEVTENPDMRERSDESMTAADLRRRRRSRSIAIAIALVVLVVAFYLVTIAKLGPDVMSRPL